MTNIVCVRHIVRSRIQKEYRRNMASGFKLKITEWIQFQFICLNITRTLYGAQIF